MKFLRCGKHVINPERIVRYRGDGDTTKYGADGSPKKEHPRTLVIGADGVRVTFKCSPEVFEEHLAKTGIEILDIPVTEAASDDDE